MTSAASSISQESVAEQEVCRAEAPTLAMESQPAREELHAVCRSLKDLLTPVPLIFWWDLLISWAICVLAFAVVVNSAWLSWPMLVAFPICVVACFRASVFIHELVHIPQRALPWFRETWNLLVGVPLLLPLVFYDGVHSSHHNRRTYGTLQDPEYQFISGRRFWIVASILGSFFIPLTLVVRFLVLGPLGLICPPFHRVLERYYSAYVINPMYKRSMNADQRRRLYHGELLILAVWGTAIILAWQGLIPWHIFLVWLAMYTSVTFINHSRMLAAHRFDSHWQPSDQLGQLLDSVDTPGAFWTEFWAPVGLRYHALHHLLPTLPYHNLGRAYRRIVRQRNSQSVYLRATSRGFPWSFIDLWRGRSLRQRGKTDSRLREK